MKTQLLYILLPVIIAMSCTSNNIKDTNKINNPELTLQTTAVFKSAEQINENEWKLIFRKLDDCQYVIFYTDLRKLDSLSYKLIISSDKTYITNPDFVNSHFNINYIEEISPDPIKTGNGVINRLREINTLQRGRFSDAGFDNDLEADDFFLKLKNYVKNDSSQEISEMLLYPLNTVINKKRIKLNDSGMFIVNYNKIFNKRIKNAILSQTLADIKSSSKGLIIGKGEILINRINNKIFITSISN